MQIEADTAKEPPRNERDSQNRRNRDGRLGQEMEEKERGKKENVATVQ